MSIKLLSLSVVNYTILAQMLAVCRALLEMSFLPIHLKKPNHAFNAFLIVIIALLLCCAVLSHVSRAAAKKMTTESVPALYRFIIVSIIIGSVCITHFYTAVPGVFMFLGAWTTQNLIQEIVLQTEINVVPIIVAQQV